MNEYVGRFAPSPTGPLHAGSLVAAMASFLDARAHAGRWLVRIEDIDEARTQAGAAERILQRLKMLGMNWDGEVCWQSQRRALYQAAYERIQHHCYPCSCTRREILDSSIGLGADGASIYPGTCRDGAHDARQARSLRVRVPRAEDAQLAFCDRNLGMQVQNLAREVGDFVVRRADGYWAYQLAVVVDDADQGVNAVVRGADLLGSTARQIYLQKLLGIATPSYFHVPVLCNAQGEKLSKQTGAAPLNCTTLAESLAAVHRAAEFLSLQVSSCDSLTQFWEQAVAQWRQRYLLGK